MIITSRTPIPGLVRALAYLAPPSHPWDVWGGVRRSPGQLPPPRSQRGYRPNRRAMKRNNKLPRRNGRN